MSKLKPIRIFRDGELPVFPQLVQKLMTLYDNGANFNDFANLINTDLGLTTQLIQCANTAFYKTDNTIIDTLLPAIRKIGQVRVIEIVTTTQLCQTFPRVTAIDMKAFWHQSLFAAVLARNLLLAVNKPGKSKTPLVDFLKTTFARFTHECTTPLEMYNLGLFSNIGLIMSLLLIPEQTTTLLKHGVVDNSDNDIYKISHACLFFWGFGEKYSEPMWYINSPLQAPFECRKSTLLLNTVLTLRAHYLPGALVPITNSYFSQIIDKLQLDITVCDDLATAALNEVDALMAYIFTA